MLFGLLICFRKDKKKDQLKDLILNDKQKKKSFVSSQSHIEISLENSESVGSTQLMNCSF